MLDYRKTDSYKLTVGTRFESKVEMAKREKEKEQKLEDISSLKRIISTYK